MEDLFVLVGSLLDSPEDWAVIAELDNTPEASTCSHMYIHVHCTCVITYSLTTCTVHVHCVHLYDDFLIF